MSISKKTINLEEALTIAAKSIQGVKFSMEQRMAISRVVYDLWPFIKYSLPSTTKKAKRVAK